MDIEATSVYGIFQDVHRLELAAMALRDAEYENTTVSVLFPDERCTTDSGHEKKTSASEGLTTKAGIGAVVGGALGWLTPNRVFTVPGFGVLIGSEPILGTLARMGGGAIVGAILGGFIDSTIRIYRTRDHVTRRQSGGFLLSLRCDRGQARRAETILRNTGAAAVSFSGSAAY